MDLIEATIKNDIETVKQLLSQGADPNVFLDEARVTPLHFAAQNNCVEIAQLLIAAGADIHAKTYPDGETPLDVAMLHGNQELITLSSSRTRGSD
jgi:ankyrin repeat protein